MNINSNLTVYGSIKSYDNSNSVTANTTFSDDIPLSINGGAYIGGGLKIGGAGNIYGNINGDVFGNITGNIGGNISGNVSGSIAGSVASVTGNVAAVTGNVDGSIGGNVVGNVKGNIEGNVNGSVAKVLGSVGQALSVGDDTCKIYGHSGNKLDFGGTGTSDIIYIGSSNTYGRQPTSYYFTVKNNEVVGKVYAGEVWGAVWNDLADCINVEFEPKPGYCYCYKNGGYFRGNKGLILGINSDTYGFALNRDDKENQLTIGVAGFVLAYTKKVYKPGTPLKPNEQGVLVKAHRWETNKIVGYFWKQEKELEWGSSVKKVLVNKRNWVKIK